MKTQPQLIIENNITQFTAKYLLELMASSTDKPTLLLLSGGSFIEVCKQLALLLTKEPLSLGKVTVSLIDERFVPIGHPDSNETQIRQSGLIEEVEKCGGTWEPILTGITAQEEETRVDELFKELLSNSELIIPVFGIGDDGHSAGILPQESETELNNNFSNRYFSYYEVDPNYPNPFKQRLTMTPQAIKTLKQSYLFAKGEKKKEVLNTLLNESRPNHEFPAKLLLDTELVVLTDQSLT